MIDFTVALLVLYIIIENNEVDKLILQRFIFIYALYLNLFFSTMARLAGIFNVLEEADRIDMRRNNIRRIKSREESDAIYNLSNTEFINSYRLSKELFHQLCEDIKPLHSRITRNSIPPKLKVYPTE